MGGRFASRRRAVAEGSSAVTFVMALPALAMLLCAVVDLGRVAYLGIEADAAAQAACRYAAERLSEGAPDVAADAVRDEALRHSPSLASPGVRLEANVACGDEQAVSVSRKVYDPDSEGFAVREAQLSQRGVSVTLQIGVSCLTPVGAAVACGDGFSLTSVAHRDVHVRP